jgi:hypothetical protein
MEVQKSPPSFFLFLSRFLILSFFGFGFAWEDFFSQFSLLISDGNQSRRFCGSRGQWRSTHYPRGSVS